MRSFNHLDAFRNISFATLAGLAAVACTGSGDASPTTTEAPKVAFTFDDLGGGSPIIQVYESVVDTPEARTATGAYNDGETVSAVCVTTGREVSSDPSVGEEARTSDKWAMLASAPDQRQYATLVYAENPDQLESQLPNCD